MPPERGSQACNTAAHAESSPCCSTSGVCRRLTPSGQVVNMACFPRQWQSQLVQACRPQPPATANSVLKTTPSVPQHCTPQQDQLCSSQQSVGRCLAQLHVSPRQCSGTSRATTMHGCTIWSVDGFNANAPPMDGHFV
jgi:hypothetical protein